MPITSPISLTEIELTRFFLAIMLLLVSAHFWGFVFSTIKLPKVIGEIFGGLLLGPSVLGFISPELHQWIFAAFPSEGKLLSAVYWLGLVLLMFVSGFEIRTRIEPKDRRLILALIVGSTALPFIAGWLAPLYYDFTPFLGSKENPAALRIIIAIAVSITSIPVISKIFLDLGIMNTRFAQVVLTVATTHDILLWIALAVATGLVATTDTSAASILGTIGVTVIFFASVLILAPKILAHREGLRLNPLSQASPLGYVLIICLLFVAIASVLNVNIVFGALLAGIVIGIIPDPRLEEEKLNIKKFSLAFFVPIYFAVVGLKIDLIHAFDFWFFLGFLAFSTVVEFAASYISAFAITKSTLSSTNLAVAMNTRGGPGIVLATVAFDLGIINEVLFVTLVLVAIATSLLAGLWFSYVQKQGLRLL